VSRPPRLRLRRHPAARPRTRDGVSDALPCPARAGRSVRRRRRGGVEEARSEASGGGGVPDLDSSFLRTPGWIRGHLSRGQAPCLLSSGVGVVACVVACPRISFYCALYARRSSTRTLQQRRARAVWARGWAVRTYSVHGKCGVCVHVTSNVPYVRLVRGNVRSSRDKTC
jgi:hypothetical protein